MKTHFVTNWLSCQSCRHVQHDVGIFGNLT